MKNIKYEKKLFLDWPADMRKKLRDMTLGYRYDSQMLHAVSLGKNPITCVAFVNKVPVGWSLVSCGKIGTVMVYIKRKFRKQGIGTKLINKFKKYKKLSAISWSEPSYYFWRKIGEKIKLNILYQNF